MRIVEEALSMPALRAGLAAAVRNRGSPGADGVTVAEFASRAEAELEELRAEVLSGAYRPKAARAVKVPKAGGGYRVLAIGCVRDRVLQHALAATLAARLDSALHDSAYAYRTGRSPKMAVEVVQARLSAGLSWVFRGDIEEFFDRIPPPLLLARLEEATEDEAVVQLVDRLLAAGVLAGRAIADPELGTPQGSPLSPFLANLYLVPFDQAVEASGLAMVRYGDDICINVATRERAEQARAIVGTALERLRLTLQQNKVEVRHHGEGFIFLGFQIDPGGRRPGARAARKLAGQLESILEQRPKDGQEEIDRLLRGWLGYYGSFAGVELPDAVRDRAEELESERAQTLQVGRVAASREPPGSSAPAVQETTSVADDANEPDAGQPSSPWQTAANLIAASAGGEDAAEIRAGLRDKLGVPEPPWTELADRLACYEGDAAAEILARLGRFGDAAAVVGIRRPPTVVAPAPAGAPVVIDRDDDDLVDRPRFEPKPEDAQRLLDLFGGAEHAFLRDVKIGDRIDRERLMIAPTVAHVREHLAGAYWMGVFPLRGNNSVRFAAVRTMLAAKLRAPRVRGPVPIDVRVVADAQRILGAARELGLTPVASIEPGRGYTVWVLFAEACGAARARILAQLISDRAGAAGDGITREIVPAQDVAKPDKPGTPAMLPLGLDPRTGERAWLCNDQLEPDADPSERLRTIVLCDAARLSAALGIKPRGVVPTPAAPTAKEQRAPSAPNAAAPPNQPDPVAIATSPFREMHRAQDVYAACSVVRHFVDQALSGGGLASSERHLLTDVLGRLGNESEASLEAVFRHLDDYRPGMAQRMMAKIYPCPTSCGRIRQKLPELTARLGCDCRFRVPPGAYPTPVLHAVGAADVPGLSERVREAAARGGLARAALAAMNEGRKEMGARAAALCARLADLRRQQRVIEKTIRGVEQELDGILEEAGEAQLETPSGTLRRVEVDGVRKFILEV